MAVQRGTRLVDPLLYLRSQPLVPAGAERSRDVVSMVDRLELGFVGVELSGEGGRRVVGWRGERGAHLGRVDQVEHDSFDVLVGARRGDGDLAAGCPLGPAVTLVDAF